jgi:predicted metalloenzyme YecM
MHKVILRRIRQNDIRFSTFSSQIRDVEKMASSTCQMAVVSCDCNANHIAIRVNDEK